MYRYYQEIKRKNSVRLLSGQTLYDSEHNWLAPDQSSLTLEFETQMHGRTWNHRFSFTGYNSFKKSRFENYVRNYTVKIFFKTE